ncbi:MAG: hypothetical protein R2711_00720 [Acidimicrobiales bacterium]
MQRLTKVIIPLMKPAILVALLFRTLDAFGSSTRSTCRPAAPEHRVVSIIGYQTLISRLNLEPGPPCRSSSPRAC